MGYGVNVSFKKMDTSSIHPFFQSLKAFAISKLDAIASDMYSLAPFVMQKSYLHHKDYYVAKEALPLVYVKTERWFINLFTYRWVYLPEWEMLVVFGMNDYLTELFDGTVYFSDCADQDYDREAYDGILKFEEIWDKWMNEDDDYIRLLMNGYLTKEEDAVKYHKRWMAYQEIWSHIEGSWFKNESVVYLALFSEYGDVLYLERFLHDCWMNGRMNLQE